MVGDQTEAQALIQLMREAQAGPQSCAVGSVKSMIGHTKCAAGIAGLIKTTLALHHRVLPPTLVETPNAKGDFEEGVLYLNTEPRPWVHGALHPRYAGVSAFGFGGTNFHAVLSEYTGDFIDHEPTASPRWPAELLVWSGPDREALRSAVERCLGSLEAGAQPALTDLAAATWKAHASSPDRPILTVVAASLDDLREKLRDASQRLRQPADRWHDPRGLDFAERPGDQGGPVAFLFPGQGAQYPNMLAQVALTFPEVRRVLDRAEATLADRLERPLGRFLYPGSTFRAGDGARESGGDHAGRRCAASHRRRRVSASRGCWSRSASSRSSSPATATANTSPSAPPGPWTRTTSSGCRIDVAPSSGRRPPRCPAAWWPWTPTPTPP